MKILSKNFSRNSAGSLKMIAEVEDDLWITYNIISKSDSVAAVTTRKVLRVSASGAEDSERVKLEIEIKVEDVEYYKEAHLLRLRGTNLTKSQHIKLGQYHTVHIELNRPFTIRKKLWDFPSIDALEKASDPKSSADLAVVLLQEGLAHIFLVGKSVTATCARIKTHIPRKYQDNSNVNLKYALNYEKALDAFFAEASQSFWAHVDFGVVRRVVIAGPGFGKDRFHRQLLSEAETNTQSKDVLTTAMLVHASSSNRHSLKEVLGNPTVRDAIKDTEVTKEVSALEEFNAMFENDPSRVCYGPKHVELASERMAIGLLLITDEVFRNSDASTRKKYVDLAESVKGLGGQVRVLSSMHASGEQLAQFTGIAAVLRFPLPELDEVEM